MEKTDGKEQTLQTHVQEGQVLGQSTITLTESEFKKIELWR